MFKKDDLVKVNDGVVSPRPMVVFKDQTEDDVYISVMEFLSPTADIDGPCIYPASYAKPISKDEALKMASKNVKRKVSYAKKYLKTAKLFHERSLQEAEEQSAMIQAAQKA